MIGKTNGTIGLHRCLFGIQGFLHQTRKHAQSGTHEWTVGYDLVCWILAKPSGAQGVGLGPAKIHVHQTSMLEYQKK